MRLVLEASRRRFVLFDTFVLNPRRWVPHAWRTLRDRWRHRARSRRALPAGTSVRLMCGCPDRQHAGVWTAEWTPRGWDRPWEAPDDYRLTRDDGATTYATRDALEVIAT